MNDVRVSHMHECCWKNGSGLLRHIKEKLHTVQKCDCCFAAQRFEMQQDKRELRGLDMDVLI